MLPLHWNLTVTGWNKISEVKNNLLVLSAILIAGTISLIIPTTTFAQSYEDSYWKDQKSSKINFQKVNCNNIIINGLDIAGHGTGSIHGALIEEGYDDGTGQWLGKKDKQSNDINENIVNFCKNKNTEVIVVEEPLPPSQITTLYVTNGGNNTVQIYDISDPLSPVHEGEFGAGDLDEPSHIAIQSTTL